MARIFGFDIGTTSIGFAVIDHDPSKQTGTILRMGVRIFPEARNPDGTPLNQQRRQKRMVRRQLRRRQARLRILADLLREAEFLPAFSKEKGSKWHDLMSKTAHKKGQEPEEIELVRDPYVLRKRGLIEALSAYQTGRVLYHLAQRRHFKGRDLSDEDEGQAEQPPETADRDESTETAEEKQAKAGRESTLRALKAEDTTLGAWLAARGPHERRRGIHAHRTVVQDEFDRLWAAQAKFHAALRDETFKARVEDAIFAQRPVFWRKNTLGECRFMPGEALCPKGAWLSQQRRMLEKLNNLALEGGNARPLDQEERAAILAKLQTQASMTWGGVRDALKPLFKTRGEAGAEKSLRFNLENGGEKKLLGNPMEAKLARIFGAEWNTHPRKQEIRDAVHARLWAADYGEIGDQRVVILSAAERKARRERAAQSFIDNFGVIADQAAALRELKFPTGWEPYSTKALKAFLPYLEDGVRFGALVGGPEWETWRNESFPHRNRPTGEVLNKLPSPAVREERERIAGLRNPTVVRTQNELRKVVNNLIGVFGKPDQIRVEVARHVGRSKRDREELLQANRKQERRRKDAIKDLESKGIAEPSRDTIERWLLWKEGQERCPYTGDQIGFDALFREGRYEVEHIWPRWRSFDDSFANKTLCRRDVNLEKRNKTPFEAFSPEPERWAAMKNRVAGMMATKGGAGMPRKKIRRFLAEEMPEGFTSRQINDTAYAARQILSQLKRLWPDVGPEAPVTVQAVTGRVTARLRRLWGLNNILSDDGEKTRADHRHHAIDALTVACTHPGMTQRLSNYWQDVDDPTAKPPDLPPPWPSIRAEAERAVARIVVSHRVRKKISGPLHEEMPLGYTGEDIAKNGKSLGIYVKRMPVEKLSLETLKTDSVEKISRIAKFVVRDNELRKLLLAHVEAAGGKADKAYPPYPRVGPDGPEIRKVRVLATQQKELMVPASTGFADPANNHHIAIYRLPDGKVNFEVVSLYEASRRLAGREPVVCRDRGDDSKFIMSLAPGETLEILEGNNKGMRIVQGVWASGIVVTHSHTDADGSSVWRPSPGSIVSSGARKVSVDPIGRIRKAND